MTGTDDTMPTIIHHTPTEIDLIIDEKKGKNALSLIGKILQGGPDDYHNPIFPTANIFDSPGIKHG